MRGKRWLAVYASVLSVLGLLEVGTQAAQASTLGKATIGASHSGGLIANVKRVNAYQLRVPASVSKMDIYLSPSGTAGSQVMEGVIYADAGGSPGALVAQSQPISFLSTSAARWYDLPFASRVTLSPGTYWLGIYTGRTAAVATYRYDRAASNRARLASHQTYVKGGASNPFGAVAWGDTHLMSLYATYTTTPVWTNQSVPAPTAPNGQLSSVSCTSSTACTAVGSYRNSSGTGTLAERWNGTSWSIQTTPTPTGASLGSLSGVSCTSSTACTAVGSYQNSSGTRTLAERWNGTSWSIQTTPNPTGASLSGVSCTSSTACTAVGSYQNSSGTGTLAERWNGTSWSVQTTPTPAGATFSTLNGVSCTSSTACTAVGSDQNSSGTDVTLAERWNGTTWSIQTTPNPAGANFSSLSGVSCTSSTACIAVGSFSAGFNGVTLAESWNGTSWSIPTTPAPQDFSSLSGVSCTSSTACTAVGSSSAELGPQVPLAERWNGTSWSVQTTPTPTGTIVSSFNGVSCTSSTACTAVGSYQNSSGTNVTLAQRWNGTTWSIQTTPNPTGTTSSSLNGVSCTAASACTAVGSGNGLTLAERWNGTSWSIQTTPNPTGTTSNSLNGVSCTSASACTAVGSSFTSSSSRTVTLAERWNGTSWSIQTTPTPAGTTDSILTGVSCTSSTACTAVGSYQNSSGTNVTLAERWNGTTWSIQTTPNSTGTSGSSLNGVSCTSASACTAVGSGNGLTLAERWNGTSWSIQTTPNPTGPGGGLSAVSCASASACTAVGSYAPDAGTVVTLAERWNGTSWSIQTTPSPTSFDDSGLTGVSCLSATACTAVGAGTNPGSGVTVAEQWNGTTWSSQTTPNPTGATISSLNGVSCAASVACTAVGSFTNSAGVQVTLAQRYG